MAFIDPSLHSVALVAEVTAGTIPATPAFQAFPFIPGTMPMLTADQLTSQVLKANRASGGSRKVNYGVKGGLKTHFRRDSAMNILLASGSSGTWTGGTLKAGRVDSSFAVEKIMSDGTNNTYHRFVGNQVAKYTLDCQASGNAEFSCDLLGMDRQTSTTAIASSTYTASTGTQFAGADIGTVSIAGLTAQYRSLTLEVSHNRELRDTFGQTSALGVGTSGFRTVTLKLQFYRTDLSADTLLAKADTPIAVSFSAGTTGNGYSFTLPAANYDVPNDIDDQSKALIEVNFVGSYDNTSGTDLSIVQL